MYRTKYNYQINGSKWRHSDTERAGDNSQLVLYKPTRTYNLNDYNQQIQIKKLNLINKAILNERAIDPFINEPFKFG